MPGTTSIRATVRAALRGEAGNYLVGTMIGSLVMFVVTGAIAAGIAGIYLFQQAITDRTGVVKETSLTDSSLRSDIRWATAIAPVDQSTVEMTVPGQGGGCHVATWRLETASGTTALTSTVVSYPDYDTTATPVRCSGSASEPVRTTVIADASPGSSFTYLNLGGRELAYTAGTPALADEAVPAGIDARTWASTILGAVSLETTVTSPSGKTVQHRTAQTADSLHLVQGPADAAVHQIPEGNLTTP